MLGKALFSAQNQHNLQGGDFRSLGRAVASLFANPPAYTAWASNRSDQVYLDS